MESQATRIFQQCSMLGVKKKWARRHVMGGPCHNPTSLLLWRKGPLIVGGLFFYFTSGVDPGLKSTQISDVGVSEIEERFAA